MHSMPTSGASAPAPPTRSPPAAAAPGRCASPASESVLGLAREREKVGEVGPGKPSRIRAHRNPHRQDPAVGLIMTMAMACLTLAWRSRSGTGSIPPSMSSTRPRSRR